MEERELFYEETLDEWVVIILDEQKNILGGNAPKEEEKLFGCWPKAW